MTKVAAYILAEVQRQGYKPGTQLYTEMCVQMMEAWGQAWTFYSTGFNWPRPVEVIFLGALVHPEMNSDGFRRVNVTISGTDVKFAPWEEVPRLVEAWCVAGREGRLNPNLAYIEFEKIHPFADGNGRVGKILFNWLSGTLRAPVLPVVPEEWRIP